MLEFEGTDFQPWRSAVNTMSGNRQHNLFISITEKFLAPVLRLKMGKTLRATKSWWRPNLQHKLWTNGGNVDQSLDKITKIIHNVLFLNVSDRSGKLKFMSTPSIGPALVTPSIPFLTPSLRTASHTVVSLSPTVIDFLLISPLP
jgi:hypothetical protein